MMLNQHFISYFVWNSHSKWLLFLRDMQENKSGCFFLNTVYSSMVTSTLGDFKFGWNLVLNFGFKPKLGLKPKLSGNLKSPTILHGWVVTFGTAKRGSTDTVAIRPRI